MSKPSERINEIYEELKKDNENSRLTEFLNAICLYLDEEYEKNHTAQPLVDRNSSKNLGLGESRFNL